MKKFIFLTILLFATMISFGQAFFSKGLISNGDVIIKNSAGLAINGDTINHIYSSGDSLIFITKGGKKFKAPVNPLDNNELNKKFGEIDSIRTVGDTTFFYDGGAIVMAGIRYPGAGSGTTPDSTWQSGTFDTLYLSSNSFITEGSGGRLEFATGGSLKAFIPNSGGSYFIMNGGGTSETPMIALFGSITLPSFTWNGDNSTGLVRIASGQTALRAGGVNTIIATSTGAKVTGDFTKNDSTLYQIIDAHASGDGAMTPSQTNDTLKYKLYRPANDTIYMTYDYNYDSNYYEVSHDTIVINVTSTPLYSKAIASYYSTASGGDTIWFEKTGDSWPLELPSVGYFLMDSSVIYDFEIEHRQRKTTVTLYDTSNLTVVIPDLTYPILDSASVYAANPDSMILYFSETVTGSLGFVVSDTITVTTYTNDGNKIGCLLSDSLVADSSYTVDYNAGVGNVADASSNTLKTLADTAVNNYVVAGAGYDVVFQAVYNAFTTKPSVADATAMNAFVVAAKEHGYWTKLDMLHIYATHINSAGEALINWINPGTYDGSENGFSGEAQWNAYRGYTGNGGVQNTFYISFGYEPSVDGVNYTLNSGSIIFYRRNTSSRAATETGTTQSTGATYRAMYGSSNATTRIFRINSNTGDSPTVTDLNGFNAVTRNSGTLYVYRNSGTPLTSYSRAATGVPNTTVTDFMGFTESGMPNSSASDAELSMTAWGGLLTDTDIGYFISDFELLMDYFGTGILP